MKIVIRGNEDEVKFDLVGEIARRYAAIPAGQMFPTIKSKFDKRFKMKIADLVSVLEKTFSIMTCAGCSSYQCTYVDLTNVVIYCDACFERASARDDRAARDFMKCSEGEEGLKEAILTALREKQQRIDFYHLNYQFYDLFDSTKVINFQDFYAQAKLMAELEHIPKGNISNLPPYFPCPLCRNLQYKEEYVLYQLPCTSAFHALCANCLEREGNLINCPLDGNQFMTKDPKKELPIFEVKPECQKEHPSDEEAKKEEKSNFLLTAASSIPPAVPQGRVRIGDTHELAEIGYPMPAFAPRTDLPLHIPRGYLTCLDKYIKIVPPPASTIVPQSSESSFLDPWYINKYENQVEVLTFASWRGTNLWGVGITNPIDNGAVVIIEYIRIYFGESAEGPSSFECELLQKELVGGTGVITDVYFNKSYPLQPFSCVTMKIRLTFQPTTDPQDPLPIYHGHHIGRYEDLEGADETVFQVMRTICVEENEQMSGQLEIIGPIVRLIYEK